MAMVYAYLIIKGLRTFKQVPAKLKDAVKQALIDLEMGHLATEEQQSKKGIDYANDQCLFKLNFRS